MAETKTEYAPLLLHVDHIFEMDDERLFEFCRVNREWRIERTAAGDLQIMPPTGGETGNRNFNIGAQLHVWAERDGSGVGFDSSTGFFLPNGAMRSPDASWVRRERLANLSGEQKERFLPPLCPDFVVELRSPTDRLAALQNKMREYSENGARLGWLVDPEEREVHVYRPEKPVEVLNNPEQVSGEPVLSGFVLALRRIWTPGL